MFAPNSKQKDGHSRTWISPKAYVESSVSQFSEQCRSTLRSANISARNVPKRVEAAISPNVVPNRLVASSPPVRLKAYKIANTLMTAEWARLSDGKDAKWFSLTFIDSRCNALEYEPRVYLPALKKRVDQLIRRAGLNALCVIEVQALSNLPRGGMGRSLMFHIHAIAWTSDMHATPKAIEDRWCASTALRHVLGAKTANVRGIQSLEALERTCAYLFKAPAVAKYVARKSTGGWEFRDTKPSRFQQLRLIECLSYLELPKIIWGVSCGASMVRPFRQQLKCWHASRLQTPLGDLKKAWKRFWIDASTKVPRAAFDFDGLNGKDDWTTWEQAARRWKRLHTAPTPLAQISVLNSDHGYGGC